MDEGGLRMGILIKGMDEIPEDGCDCISRQAAIDALENTKEVAR